MGIDEKLSREVREAINDSLGFNKIVCPKCKIKNPKGNTSCRKCGYNFDKASGKIRTKNSEPAG